MKRKKYPRSVTVYVDGEKICLIFTRANCVKGIYRKYHFRAKVYAASSKSGINCGRIRALRIWETDDDGLKSRDVANFYRGWNMKPKWRDLICYGKIFRMLNMVPLRSKSIIYSVSTIPKFFT